METAQGEAFQNHYAHPTAFLQPRPDSDTLESFEPPASSHPSVYTTAGASDPHRRDGTGNIHSYQVASIRDPHGSLRFSSDAGLASNSFRAGNSFSDPTLTSIAPSASPSSSQYGYNPITTLPVHPVTHLPNLSNPVQHPVSGYHPVYREAVIDSTGNSSLHLPPPNFGRPTVPSSPIYQGERSFTTVARTQYPVSGFQPYDTSRSNQPSTNCYTGQAYVGQMDVRNMRDEELTDCSKFPWDTLELTTAELMCNGTRLEPDIHAQVEKGFFICREDGKWTCYRRNYFSVNTSYTIPAWTENQRIHLHRNGTKELVNAIAIRVSAIVDGQNGKTIELVQHTAKRDQGPKLKLRPWRMIPNSANKSQQLQHPTAYGPGAMVPFHQPGHAGSPSLSQQHHIDLEGIEENDLAIAAMYPQGTTTGQEQTHIFDRIQFKTATANNGKRRASQQYFHVVTEVMADTRKNIDDEPNWHVVAKRVSGNIVVRGRSPSHYQHGHGHEGSGRGRGNGGAGRRYSNAGSSHMHHGMGYGPMTQSPMRSPGTGSSTHGGGMSFSTFNYDFRPNNMYPLHESDEGSASDGSQSIEGADMDGEHHHPAGMLSHPDRSALHDINGYSYHPSPMYVPVNHLPSPNFGGLPRPITNPQDHPFKLELPQAHVGSEYHPHRHFTHTSRNQYPDTSGGVGPSYT